MAVSQDDTDLGGSSTLAGQLADVVDDGVGRALEPGGHAARVGDGGGGNTLALAVEATHVGGGMGCRIVERKVLFVVVWLVVEKNRRQDRVGAIWKILAVKETRLTLD